MSSVALNVASEGGTVLDITSMNIVHWILKT